MHVAMVCVYVVWEPPCKFVMNGIERIFIIILVLILIMHK